MNRRWLHDLTVKVQYEITSLLPLRTSTDSSDSMSTRHFSINHFNCDRQSKISHEYHIIVLYTGMQCTGDIMLYSVA